MRRTVNPDNRGPNPLLSAKCRVGVIGNTVGSDPIVGSSNLSPCAYERISFCYDGAIGVLLGD